MKRSGTTPTKREALEAVKQTMTALEAMAMCLAIWRGSKGTEVEARCFAEVQRLAEHIYKNMKPQGHLAVQMGLEQLTKEQATSGDTGDDSVVDVSATSREERDIRHQSTEGEVGVPEAGGGTVEASAEVPVARGLRAVVDEER